jgi:hypothetical protein
MILAFPPRPPHSARPHLHVRLRRRGFSSFAMTATRLRNEDGDILLAREFCGAILAPCRFPFPAGEPCGGAHPANDAESLPPRSVPPLMIRTPPYL